MPLCKNCHRNISRFDKDICPYCGFINPIDDTYETKDVTSLANPVKEGFKLYKSKSKTLFLVFAFTLSFFGIHEFYLGFKRRGFIYLIINLMATAIIGSSLAFIPSPAILSPLWSYLVTFFAIYLVNILLSIRFLFKESLKDKRGEFLR